MGGALALCASILAAPAPLQKTETGGFELGVRHELVMDTEVAGTLLFELPLPEDVMAWRAELTCTRADLDLYFGRGPLPAEEDVFEGAIYSALAEDPVEVLRVDRLSEPAVDGGRWWMAVHCPYPDQTALLDDRGRPLGDSYELPFQLRVDVHRARTEAVLAPGTSAKRGIGPASGHFRTFEVEVPADAGVLRIDLVHATHDLDVFVRRRRPMRSRAGAMFAAEHSWGRETLVIDGESRPALRPGTWFVDVIDPWQSEFESSFEILATFGAEPPERLLGLPAALEPQADGPLGAASVGVVEVMAPNGDGGSGTVLTPDGLVLTNAHVVLGSDGGPLEEVVLALSLSPREPPVELFRAKVRQFDMDLDLALLQADSGFYGQPIPASWRFPIVELGAPGAMQVGEPLWVVGYPTLGGSLNRVGLNVSRGVLSGFEFFGPGPVFKTDASIRSGNSGGAALDSEGRLVGVPTSVMGDEYGTVGIVHPLDLLPAEWLAGTGLRLAEE